MEKRFFTIMLIPDKSTRVKRIVIPHAHLKLIVAMACLLLVLFALFFFGFFHYRKLHSYDEAMRQENLQYRKELELIRTKVATVETYVERVKRFDKKLRIITNLEDPERQVALGPLEASLETNDHLEAPMPQDAEEMGDYPIAISPEFPDANGVATSKESGNIRKLQEVQGSLDELELAAAEREGSLQDLENKLKNMGALLRATPAIWPAKGWVTSNYGYRVSPFSGERSMHSGLDVAARPGTPVNAPADGIVTFVGTLGGLGKTIIINHGYGTITRFGHLSEIFIEMGDTVKRGDKLAAIGNTGRSTGPHLHYEVVVNGIPHDPRKYILN